MNKSITVLKIIAGLVGAVAGYLIVGHLLHPANDAAHFEKALTDVASDMNKTLPMSVDGETRLDSTAPGPGLKFTYVYTLLKHDKSELDVPSLEKSLKPKIVANYKTSPEMKQFRDMNVQLVYQYKDKNGESLFEIAVTPADF